MKNFKDMADEYGLSNLRMIIPMSKLMLAGFIPGLALRNHDAPRDPVLCKFIETHFKIKDDYKVQLEAVDHPEIYGRESFYTMDLRSLMASGPDEYKLFVLNSDGYQRLFLT